MQPLIEVRNLRKEFTVRRSRSRVRAVDDVSFWVGERETLGLVGESGSGKSTVARCLLRLVDPDGGEIRYHGNDVLRYGRREFRQLRPKLQMVFQDPQQSLDPRMHIEDSIREPLDLWSQDTMVEKQRRVVALAEMVRLDREHLKRFPHQLSGGQLQRVGIARALITDPDFVVLDEPTSSLDLSIRAEILDLLRGLQADLGFSYLLISHDLTTVHRMCARLAVMYLGKIVETGLTDQVLRHPAHPYTRALLSSAPLPTAGLPVSGEMLDGEIPSPTEILPGCHLYSRCAHRLASCRDAYPELEEVEPGHHVACFRAQAIVSAASWDKPLHLLPG